MLWILAESFTRFMESLDFLNTIFAWFLGEKSTGPSEFNFSCISPPNSLNLVLILGAKFNGYRNLDKV